MKKLSFLKDKKKLFFIGIGGISLSGIAKICFQLGYEVFGSDITINDNIELLKKLGLMVFVGHNASNIQKVNPDVVVYSGAIKSDNVERIFALKNNIITYERSEFLGLMLKEYKNVISVSGSHGKTTTTCMISEIFLKAKLNPTIHIGGESVNLNTNSLCGDREFFINEACEYRKSFLQFNSKMGVILNIEEDHPDCYKNLSEIQNAFSSFSKICENVVINDDYKNLIQKRDNVITFSYKNGNFTVKKKYKLKNGGYSFVVYKNDKEYGKFILNIFGKHNIYNALASIAVCDYFKINKRIIKDALFEFKGIKRRFEEVNTSVVEGKVYFDYAHHPTEIKNLIDEVREEKKRIFCVFQPHTFSRTNQYFQEFCNAFVGVDKMIFLKTYSARERKIKKSRSYDIYNVVKNKIPSVYFSNKESSINYLKTETTKKDIILFVGAGDIYDLKKKLV